MVRLVGATVLLFHNPGKFGRVRSRLPGAELRSGGLELPHTSVRSFFSSFRFFVFSPHPCGVRNRLELLVSCARVRLTSTDHVWYGVYSHGVGFRWPCCSVPRPHLHLEEDCLRLILSAAGGGNPRHFGRQ
ncbi:unnamed protein product [Ectocarpus sp. 6 AP-2014]